jgi:hypothetical protein
MVSFGRKLTRRNFTNVATNNKFHPTNSNNFSYEYFGMTDRSSNMHALLPLERHIKCRKYFSAYSVDVDTELL